MTFQRFLPCDRLKPYVDFFAIQETVEQGDYKVLPGTGLVLGFQFKGKLSWVQDSKIIPLAPSGISGLSNRFRIFSNSQGIGTILVFFKEAGAAHFFKQPLHELFGESISLENFLLRSELLVIEEQLCDAGTDLKRIDVIEKFLLSQLRSLTPDKLVVTALALIHQRKGNIKISQLASDLHISQSPLEKRFRQVVGTSPKKFALIVRMKHLLNAFTEGHSLTVLGYDAGFYDQPHFIKEFRAFTGETPTTFFVKKT